MSEPLTAEQVVVPFVSRPKKGDAVVTQGSDCYVIKQWNGERWVFLNVALTLWGAKRIARKAHGRPYGAVVWAP